jgi:ribosomal protein S18 acetylase RimI-like enzyme
MKPAPIPRMRPYMPADFEAVTALWQACALHPSRSDTSEGLARKLERDPDLFLLLEEDGATVATVMGSYDGRRGWINRLAVAPSHRGRDIGRQLVGEIERRLKARGCDKVNLLIEPDNAEVADYYDRLGYRRDALIFMEKWLD